MKFLHSFVKKPNERKFRVIKKIKKQFREEKILLFVKLLFACIWGGWADYLQKQKNKNNLKIK